DATEVAMQFFAQGFVAEERPPVFGGKDRVHENFGEGLRHDRMMRDVGIGCNPFRVDEIGVRVTQGSPTLRANPGLSDGIPLGFLKARSIPIVYATNHQIEINSSDAWGFDERPRRETHPSQSRWD